MAGSFDIFRRNQKAALAALAIMAMIAFFVIPPFLQMDGSSGRDTPVASWRGGELRESGLERAMFMRVGLNRFLAEAAVAANRDPNRIGLLPGDERSVVRTAFLASEAAANGVVVSDGSINDFLAQWTNNLVRRDQFDQIIGRLRVGSAGVSQHDLFEALRSLLAAESMQMLVRSGFSGDPPGWRWDYFRRLEQSATIEAVPVVVQEFAAAVPAPTEPQLRTFFEKYKDTLPEARSATPGFRAPQRAKYEYLVASMETLEAEAAKEVTDAQIAEYYEKNKEQLFRARPPAEKSAAADEKSGTTTDGKPADGGAGKPETKPAPAADKGGSMGRRSPFLPAAFRQPAAGEKPQAAPGSAPDATQAEGTDAAEKAAPVPVEPLEKVKDEVRRQLARQAADARVEAMFAAIAGDVSEYAEAMMLWQAEGKAAGAAAPAPPDVDKIARTQGLQAVRSELVTADEAVAAGGVAGSFKLVQDASSRFGIRQQQWLDMIFGSGAPILRPVTSSDAVGNRYISWKTEDQPEFTPTFQTARADVERAWRIIEARRLARDKAELIARQAAADGRTLEEAVAGQAGLTVEKVGPFTWLTQGTVPFGAAPSLSEPDGIAMPGEAFMRAVFSLDPGRTAVAFNEPETVCYVVRVASLDPPLEKLQERFLESRTDQRRLAMVAQREVAQAASAWFEELERRREFTWHREPR